MAILRTTDYGSFAYDTRWQFSVYLFYPRVGNRQLTRSNLGGQVRFAERKQWRCVAEVNSVQQQRRNNKVYYRC